MEAQQLRAIRKQLGWSQARLAEAVGVTSNSIARQERGEIGIKESLARLILLIAQQVEQNESTCTTYSRSSRQHSPRKSTKGSDSTNSQDKSRGRTR